MPRFVALLRGVNVGKGNRVPMADLRALLESLGYGDAGTLLNSGNAVFTSAGRSGARHAQAIRAGLVRRLGVDVPVIVKSAAEMAAIVAENRLDAATRDPSRFLVAFTADPESLAALSALSGLVRPPEQFQLGRHAAFLWCRRGSLQSEAGKALLGRPGRAATTRNWATVQKLLALLGPAGP